MQTTHMTTLEKHAHRIPKPSALKYRVVLDARHFAPGRFPEIIEWCKATLQGRWRLLAVPHLPKRRFHFDYAMGFSRKEDAALFRLSWC